MSVRTIITQNGLNGQPSPKARAFTAAFCPPRSQQNTARLWAAEASRAINVLIDFRSAAHRWMALGQIDPAEFSAQVEALDFAGLSDFVDELTALGTVANCGGEL